MKYLCRDDVNPEKGFVSYLGGCLYTFIYLNFFYFIVNTFVINT